MRLDELRAALGAQAHEVVDHGSQARVEAVRSRVRTARRRRAAATTTAAVLAVAAIVVGFPALLEKIGPKQLAPVTLAGRPVPNEHVANGFTYRYVRGVEGAPGEDELSMTVNPRFGTMLVAFASSDDDAVLQLQAGKDPRHTTGSVGGGFENFLLVRGGRQQVTLSQADGVTGQLAMALYQPGRDMPDGVTNGEVVLRQQMAGFDLVDGRIGAPGETELSFEITPPDGPLLWGYPLCYGGRENSTVRYSIDGIPGAREYDISCGMPVPEDPNNMERGYAGGTIDLASQGVPVTVKVWLAHSASGTKLDDADAVIGLGVYAERVPRLEVAGVEVLSRAEVFGHDWRAVDLIEIPAGIDTYDVTLEESDSPRTVAIVSPPVPGDDPYAVIVEVVGGPDWGWFVDRRVPTYFPHLPVLPGAERSVHVSISDGRVSSAPVGLVVWEQID